MGGKVFLRLGNELAVELYPGAFLPWLQHCRCACYSTCIPDEEPVGQSAMSEPGGGGAAQAFQEY